MTLITPAVVTTLLVITPPPPFHPVTATPTPCQQHTDTMENGVASTWRGVGVQGMSENFIFLFSLLTMLLQCPPTSPILWTHTHPTRHVPHATPHAEQPKQAPMGLFWLFGIFLTHPTYP